MFKMFKLLTPELELKPGTVLFEQGDDGDKCYIIHSGCVDLYHNGRRVASLSDWDMVGEMALVEESHRLATAKAGWQGAKLYVISKARFLKMVKAQPEFSLEIIKVLSQRLRASGALGAR